jgi:hypothetical protein
MDDQNRQTIHAVRNIQRGMDASRAQLHPAAHAVQQRRAKERAVFGLPCPTMSGPTLVDYREANTSKIHPWKKVADYKTISVSNPYRIKTLRQE